MQWDQNTKEFNRRKWKYMLFLFSMCKIVTCGDGGAITCNDKNMYEKLQSKIWYGLIKRKRK